MTYGVDKWPTHPGMWNTANSNVEPGPSVKPWVEAGNFVPYEKREAAAPHAGSMAAEAADVTKEG